MTNQATKLLYYKFLSLYWCIVAMINATQHIYCYTTIFIFTSQCFHAKGRKILPQHLHNYYIILVVS